MRQSNGRAFGWRFEPKLASNKLELKRMDALIGQGKSRLAGAADSRI